jgi:hypothetical protein
MPFPPPATGRSLVHKRQVNCEGYLRDDGLWDIEGWVTDVKAEVYHNFDRGDVPPGEHLHGMGLRITIDNDYTIVDAEAVMDFSPYRICPEITPSFKKLIGMSLKKGFNARVRETFAGAHGCVHLVELLGPMATTAMQTAGYKRNMILRQEGAKGGTKKPPFFDTCHTWSSGSSVVKREFPALYTGKD